VNVSEGVTFAEANMEKKIDANTKKYYNSEYFEETFVSSYSMPFINCFNEVCTNFFLQIMSILN